MSLSCALTTYTNRRGTGIKREKNVYEVSLTREVVADSPIQTVLDFISQVKEGWYYAVTDLATGEKLIVPLMSHSNRLMKEEKSDEVQGTIQCRG